jgi:hypothetical protein
MAVAAAAPGIRSGTGVNVRPSKDARPDPVPTHNKPFSVSLIVLMTLSGNPSSMVKSVRIY